MCAAEGDGVAADVEGGYVVGGEVDFETTAWGCCFHWRGVVLVLGFGLFGGVEG